MFPATQNTSSSYSQFFQLQAPHSFVVSPLPLFAPLHHMLPPVSFQEAFRAAYTPQWAAAPYPPMPFTVQQFHAPSTSSHYVSPAPHGPWAWSRAFYNTVACGIQIAQPPLSQPEPFRGPYAIARQAYRGEVSPLNFDDEGPPPLLFCPSLSVPQAEDRAIASSAQEMPSFVEVPRTADLKKRCVRSLKASRGTPVDPDWKELLHAIINYKVPAGNSVKVLFFHVKRYFQEQNKKGICVLQAIKNMQQSDQTDLLTATALYFAILGQRQHLLCALSDNISLIHLTQIFFFLVFPLCLDLKQRYMSVKLISDPNFDADPQHRMLIFKEIAKKHYMAILTRFHGGAPVIELIVRERLSVLFDILVQEPEIRVALCTALFSESSHPSVRCLFSRLFKNDGEYPPPSHEWLVLFQQLGLSQENLVKVLSAPALTLERAAPLDTCKNMIKKLKNNIVHRQDAIMQWKKFKQELQALLDV